MPVASTSVFVALKLVQSMLLLMICKQLVLVFYTECQSSSLHQSGRYKKVLLIGADKMSSIIDYTDRATCIIFGDGAGAVLFRT
jgi:3-oxoacyl-[acyl-carrier-protein] synthase-3